MSTTKICLHNVNRPFYIKGKDFNINLHILIYISLLIYKPSINHIARLTDQIMMCFTRQRFQGFFSNLFRIGERPSFDRSLKRSIK